MKAKSRWISWRMISAKLKKFGIVIGTACVGISLAGTSMAASAPSPTITEVTNGRVTQLWTAPITLAMAQLMQAEAQTQTTASNSQTTISPNTEAGHQIHSSLAPTPTTYMRTDLPPQMGTPMDTAILRPHSATLH